ncbi:hypothetical protein ABS768_00865 [Flavobacterium sp. ST-75]|uniref:DUF2798 domain-containing protein n=1 Tax=Flavobacterium rhizophilum TaxID=3163296 RepID=A0ABW8Y9U8_9FLAO
MKNNPFPVNQFYPQNKLRIMRILSLILSTIAFFSTAFYAVAEFPDLTTAGGVLYFLMLVILLLIFITAIVLSLPSGIVRFGNKFK